MTQFIHQPHDKLFKQSLADKTTEADVVYTVKIEDTLGYLYILCEHQSEVDEAIAFRLLVYTARIMEMHLRQNPKSPLPLVYPLVVYSGEKPWNAPVSYLNSLANKKLLRNNFFSKRIN